MRSGESNGAHRAELGATTRQSGSSMRDTGSMRSVRAERRSRPCSTTVPAWSSNAVTGSSGHSESGSSRGPPPRRRTGSVEVWNRPFCARGRRRQRRASTGKSRGGALLTSCIDLEGGRRDRSGAMLHVVGTIRPATAERPTPEVSGVVRTRPLHTTSVNTVPRRTRRQQATARTRAPIPAPVRRRGEATVEQDGSCQQQGVARPSGRARRGRFALIAGHGGVDREAVVVSRSPLR